MYGPIIGIIFGVIIVLILLISAVKILREYERGVIFRFGRLSGARGPGIFIIRRNHNPSMHSSYASWFQDRTRL